jgi:hypothetical protein
MNKKAWASLAATAAALFFAVVSSSGCGDYPVAGLKSGSAGTSSTPTAGTGSGGGSGTSGAPQVMPGTLPCQVLNDAGNECVSAHSTVRVIVPGYTGPLYQVDNGTGTLDINSVGGYADAAAHDTFCEGSCTIKIIYDQSGRGNHLTKAPPGSAKPTPSNEASADKLPVKINGHSAYGILFRPNQGYRAACNECLYPEKFPSGVPVGDEPQTVYMVSSQHDLINGCCFDYGNAEVTANNDGNGTMEAVYLGQGVIWGSGSGSGPWVMADLENGLYPGWENQSFKNISTSTSMTFDFVTGVVVGDTADKNGGKGRFAVYGGDATVSTITQLYDGVRPEKPGYVPMQKQGSVILAIGGDNSDGDGGRFYEGAIALKAATKDVVSALQVAIAQAGYGK